MEELESQKARHASGWLIGDLGYACRKFLLTPYNENEIEEAYQLRSFNVKMENTLIIRSLPNNLYTFTFFIHRYNDALALTRCRIESTYGMVKRRFFCLRERLRFRPCFATRIITAAVVLWNLSLNLGKFIIKTKSLFKISTNKVNLELFMYCILKISLPLIYPLQFKKILKAMETGCPVRNWTLMVICWTGRSMFMDVLGGRRLPGNISAKFLVTS